MDSPEIVAKKIPGVGVSTAIRWQQALKGFREDDVVLKTLQEYQILPPTPAGCWRNTRISSSG